MGMRRWRLAQWLTATGGTVFGMGVLLLLIKLVMLIAWHAIWIVLAGAILVAAGLVLRGIR